MPFPAVVNEKVYFSGIHLYIPKKNTPFTGVNGVLVFRENYLPQNSLATFTMFSEDRPKAFSRAPAGPE